MKKLWILYFTCLTMVFSAIAIADEPVDLQMISKIKNEASKNSQVMETLSWLTDVHGPRLTGTPQLVKAQEWARDQLTEWGVENARLEAWGTFGNGWAVKQYSVEMIEPQYSNLIAHPLAWTPGTDSVVIGNVVMIDYNDEDYEENFAGKLKNAIVLLGEPREALDHSKPNEERYTAEDLKEKMEAPDPVPAPRDMERIQNWRKLRKQIEEINKFLVKEGAVAVLRSSRLDHGTLRVLSGGSYKTSASRAMPSLVVAMEHYNRMARLVEKDIPVKVKVYVETEFFTDDTLAYNVLGEIPGTDRKLKNEVVMLGAHIDSWHAGTGATDNGAGSAVMMEVMRILKALDFQPKRTIRIGLWSGEEHGLYGSRGYVKKHLADRKSMETMAAHEKFSAYYNIDNGSGKIRGIHLQGNDAARPFFEAMIKPFNDMGVTAVTIQETGSTDHKAFDEVGLPGFQFIQDRLSYFARTWHTNMDVYDHANENDLVQMSIVVASMVAHTANRDEKIPRKPMPEAQNR